MSRPAFTAFCMCIGVKSEDSVSMLQTNRLNVDRTSPPKVMVNFDLETCDHSWSGSNGKFTIQFDGDGTLYPLGPFKTGNTDNFQLGVESGADLSRFEVKALGGDGWCASSFAVNGNNVLDEETWFDNPCTTSNYKGINCFPSFKFHPPLAETSVIVTTCGTSHAQSAGQFFIQFDGDSQKRQLGQMKSAKKTYTFDVEHDAAANLQKFTVSTDQSDGLCATSISVNGQEAIGQGSIWLDKPCGTYHYDGSTCDSSYTFDLTAPPVSKTSVSVTTCATKHAQSSGQFYIQFDGDSQKRSLVQMKSTNKKYTFEVLHNAAADLNKFTIFTEQSDGLCATSISVNGQEAIGQGSIWLDKPCETYHYDGTSCHPSYTFDLTPAPIEIAKPEFDMNEGNACKPGYNFIRTEGDCINAAKVIKLAGQLGTFTNARVVTNRPSGCYMQTNAKQAVTYRRVIYNTHETGAAHAQAMIICKKA